MKHMHDTAARHAVRLSWRSVPVARVIAYLRGRRITPRSVAAAGLLVLLMGVAAPRLGAGQDDHKKKVPVFDKITSVPEGQNEFNGKVQSLDLKNDVLNVQSLREDDTEIFPIKKTVTVAAANGYRVDISALKPGTNVLVYFDQRGDKRKVKEIVILGEAPATGAKAPAAPPS